MHIFIFFPRWKPGYEAVRKRSVPSSCKGEKVQIRVKFVNTAKYTNTVQLLNPSKAIEGHFDPVKLRKLYVDRASKINT